MRSFLFALMACVAVAAQQPAPDPALQKLVDQHFGTGCKIFSLAPNQVPSTAERELIAKPLYTGDLDGDGVEDAVIVAKCTNPLAASAELGFKVADPYDEYYGFGDPKVTQQFALQEPDRARVLLVIHGAGQDAWKAATPKARIAIINMPFDRLAIAKLTIKKKIRWAISAEETGTITSAIYWDGKKYKWEPMAGQ